MKVFITNQYGYITDKTIASRQSEFARIGHELGFYEMGLFVCDLSSENDFELSKRLDGIIASVEKDDVVIVQLPTGNGQRFEEALFDKIVVYSGKKPLILWQSTKYYYENHNKYIGCRLDEYVPATKLENDVLDLTGKKVLIDLVSDNLVRDDSEMEEIENAVHIGFGMHDRDGNYSVWVGTTMQSIIEHTDAKIVFHILHDDTLTDANRSKLKLVAEGAGDKIEFHAFDPLVFGNLNEMIGRYTIGTMFRVMLPDILPNIGRIIYLDADLFVNRDIKELWDVDISDFCLAAAPDHPTIRYNGTPYPVDCNQVSREKYFNAGVLYMNLDNMRKNGNTFQLILNYLNENPKAFLFDQDALNVVFAGKCFLLDGDWNYFIDEVRRVENAKAERKIYHYAANYLVLYYKNEVDNLYYQTILRTPWAEQEGSVCLKKSVFRLVDRAQQLECLLHKTARGKNKVIFYGTKSWAMMNAMKLLNFEESECICYEHIETSMIENSDDVIYIVCAGADDGNGLAKLQNAGLELGKNYFIIQRFLDVSKGGFIL